MTNIHFFNPETEIVLGLDKDTYTPNPRVTYFRKRLSLLPALYGETGDIIMTEGVEISEIPSMPFYEIAVAKDMEIMAIERPFRKVLENPQSFSLQPWGWNKEVVRRAATKLGTLQVPQKESIRVLRQLAHRGQTTAFFEMWKGTLLNNHTVPEIIRSKEQLIDFLTRHDSFCLKAPWSSSGRGVIFSTDISQEKALNWAEACIRHQGAVMGEPLYEVRYNLASEWNIDTTEGHFLGFSLFKTSESGKYLGNHLIPQTEIERIIADSSTISIQEVMHMQKVFIKERIVGKYTGPLGIDMLITPAGILNPCVEMNVRRTMGHVALAIEKQLYSANDFIIKALFEKTFPEIIFSALEFV